jgi:alkylation response protein AidB-like acyl-CoA dehydrogenase
MTVFSKHLNYLDYSEKTLSQTLINRDKSGAFDLETFNQFAKKNLFLVFDQLEPTHLDILQNYYNIARGSLDLPFTSSLAAHGFVGMLMLKKFGSTDQIKKFKTDFETGKCISAICNSESGTAVNLKKMTAHLVQDVQKNYELNLTKPCITNGKIANVLMTTMYNDQALELYLLLSEEVEQLSVNTQLVGFRTGDSGKVIGKKALPDLMSRKLTSEKDTLKALKYCFFVERLIVSVMATGVAHGLEDYLIKVKPEALSEISGDNKQYLQEKVLKLHMTRIQMSSLLETIINRGSENFQKSESELAILKLMISEELRAAVYSCVEIMGHGSLYTDSVVAKVLRDIQMCSFFGGTPELQKISLYNSISSKKIKVGA